MIYLFTDFGAHDLYVGQLKAVLQRLAPGIPQIDLLHDARPYDVLSAAHLLAVLRGQMQEGDVMLAVVDPGVGGARRPVALQVDGCWCVGPDNGLLSVLAQRAVECSVQEILWRPLQSSVSFHGRDLFAPIVAGLATGKLEEKALRPVGRLEVEIDAGDLPQLIYADHYGNLMTGLRGGTLSDTARLRLQGHEISHAPVFSSVPVGHACWYVNSLGLVEIAVNQGNAAQQLGAQVGAALEVISR